MTMPRPTYAELVLTVLFIAVSCTWLYREVQHKNRLAEIRDAAIAVNTEVAGFYTDNWRSVMPRLRRANAELQKATVP